VKDVAKKLVLNLITIYCLFEGNMKTAKEAYWEALKGINIKENEKIVLESKDIHYCCCFARNIFQANTKPFEELILERKECWYCYWFAKYVKESNRENLFKVILESGHGDCINNFLKNVEFNKEKFANYLLFI